VVLVADVAQDADEVDLPLHKQTERQRRMNRESHSLLQIFLKILY
jgi:hypothetical protein